MSDETGVFCYYHGQPLTREQAREVFGTDAGACFTYQSEDGKVRGLVGYFGGIPIIANYTEAGR